jgi:hypothetical protein
MRTKLGGVGGRFDVTRSTNPDSDASHGDNQLTISPIDAVIGPEPQSMAARKDRIRYEYVETPDGGRVNITTGDRHILRNHSGILVQPLHRDWMTRGSPGPR